MKFISYINTNGKLNHLDLIDLGNDTYTFNEINEESLLMGVYLDGVKYAMRENVSSLELLAQCEDIDLSLVNENDFFPSGRVFNIAITQLTKVESAGLSEQNILDLGFIKSPLENDVEGNSKKINSLDQITSNKVITTEINSPTKQCVSLGDFITIRRTTLPSPNRSVWLGQTGNEFKMVASQNIQGENYLKDGGQFNPETIRVKCTDQTLTGGQWYLMTSLNGSLVFQPVANDSAISNWFKDPIWWDFDQNKLREVQMVTFYSFDTVNAVWDWTINHYDTNDSITQTQKTNISQASGTYRFGQTIYMLKQSANQRRSLSMYIKPNQDQTIYSGVLQFHVA